MRDELRERGREPVDVLEGRAEPDARPYGAGLLVVGEQGVGELVRAELSVPHADPVFG